MSSDTLQVTVLDGGDTIQAQIVEYVDKAVAVAEAVAEAATYTDDQIAILADGLVPVGPVDAAATSNYTGSFPFAGLPSSSATDGQTLTEGQRLLLPYQTAASRSGVWVVSADAWTRPADYATGSSATGHEVTVLAGETLGGSRFIVSSSNPNIIDTNAVTWEQTNFPSIGRPTSALDGKPVLWDNGSLSLEDATSLLESWFLVPASAHEYWVSPYGNDLFAGTLQKPFATLAKALAMSDGSTPLVVHLGAHGTEYATATEISSSADNITIHAATSAGQVTYGQNSVILKATAAMSAVLSLTGTNCKVMGVSIDGGGYAGYGLNMTGSHPQVVNCAAGNCTTASAYIGGSQGKTIGNLWQGSTGNTAAVIYDCTDLQTIAEYVGATGATYAAEFDATEMLFIGCHITGGTWNAHVTNTNVRFSGCYFDTPGITGGAIWVDAAAQNILGTSIIACGFYHHTPHLVPAIYLDGTVNNVEGTIITGCGFYTASYGSDMYSYAVSSAGTVVGTILADINGRAVNSLWDVRPLQVSKCMTCPTTSTFAGSTSAGTFTQSGNGTKKVFTKTVSLAAADTGAANVQVSAASNDAAAPFYTTWSAGTLTVTYLTAPPSGTNNVALNYLVEL